MPRPFHAAIVVDDLDEARRFYGDLLGCAEGRSDRDWVDFDFFGHQLVCHRVTSRDRAVSKSNPRSNVDGKRVPLPHFGIVLAMHEWEALADRLRAAKIEFMVEPDIRFRGKVGEQGTFFITDSCGNALEFKGFRNPDQLFAS